MKTTRERADLLPVLGEVFREHGYEGATLAIIGARTELGRGSLYNFFPGGKTEMAAAVLDAIDLWFETNVFRPLRDDPDSRLAIIATLDATETYFRSGRRVCLVGVFALDDTRDRFAFQVSDYFTRWNEAMTRALVRKGLAPQQAAAASEEALVAIQGGLVLARALDDPAVFQRAIARTKARLEEAG